VPLVKVASPGDARRHARRAARRGLLQPPVAGGHVAVKEAVLPFNRFPEVDTVLGPEMRSTGEVMGIDPPSARRSSRPSWQREPCCPPRARCSSRWPTATSRPGWWWPRLRELGLGIAATKGTCDYLGRFGSRSTRWSARSPTAHGSRRRPDRERPDRFVINTPQGRWPHRRRADPQGCQQSPGQLGHHCRGRAGRRAGHGRAWSVTINGALAAGVPPRDPAAHRRAGRVDRAAGPVMTASGTAGSRRRAGALHGSRRRSAPWW
jgi:hypothetical protein